MIKIESDFSLFHSVGIVTFDRYKMKFNEKLIELKTKDLRSLKYSHGSLKKIVVRLYLTSMRKQNDKTTGGDRQMEE